jgi:small-conductance mechanosensitive channel
MVFELFNLFIPDEQIALQIVRFLVVLLIGIALTQLVFVPLIDRLTSPRSGKKAKHQFKNLATVVGFFLAITAALEAGQFGNLVTIIGTIAAALTVGLGWGMRDQVANLVAGVFIHLDNPFVKGDYIQVGEEEGEVREINLRTTEINGHASEKIVVPNGLLSNNNLKNYTRGIKTKSSINFKVAPEKAEKVAEIIERLVREDEEVLKNPEPSVLYRKFEDDKTVFEARYWVEDSRDSKKVKSRILEKFNTEIVDTELFKEEKKEES